MAEVSLLNDKVRRYGVLGAGIVCDSHASLQLAKLRDPAPELAVPPQVPAKAKQVPAKADGYPPPISVTAKRGQPLTRQQILEILSETVRVQGIVQREVGALARKLAKEKKKKKVSLSFEDAHKKILDLSLPKEPLEDLGLTEAALQQIISEYDGDQEVMDSAQKLLHPMGKVDPESAKGFSVERVVEIHQFMVLEMGKVLEEFVQLPFESRMTYTSKGVEMTAELLVSIAVEQQLGVHCEDVEQAVMRHEVALQGHPEFHRCTEQLANMMQHLVGASQERVRKEDFVRALGVMCESVKEAKAFALKLYGDYRAKLCSAAEAYKRFEAFTVEAQAQTDKEDLPDISPIEMQLCMMEYREDPEVVQLWERSGVESSIGLQTLALRGPRGQPLEDRKGRKLKASEVVEMQEFMADELKRTMEPCVAAAKKKGSNWKPEIAVQMVQALASSAVERRLGVTAEEMCDAGFYYAATLQQNPRFVRASEKQQELLSAVASACQKGQDGS